MTPDEALELARYWAGRGLPVFPIAIGWDDTKQATSKRPLTDRGHLSAARDDDTIPRLFGDAQRRLRDGEVLAVGVHPGPAGRMVLDVDVKGGQRGDDELAALEAAHGPLPDAPVVLTASGGQHIWLEKPDGVHVGNADLAHGVEVRADDGWVVAPGVNTPWGSWTFDAVTADLPPPFAPDWILDRLGATNGDRAPSRPWQPVDRDQLHPADLAALQALEQLGGHGAHVGREGEVRVTRPGKRSGTSATIGYSSPGVVRVWTSSWPELPQGWYDLDGGGKLVPSNAVTVLDDPPADGPPQLTVVPAEDFAAVDEPGAEALLGEPGQPLIPADGDVMIYGDGGAGKTTLAVDLAAHLAAGDSWLNIPVTSPLSVLLVENEGPRPLFRSKLDDKLDAWDGSPLDRRLHVLEDPWAAFNFAQETHRNQLAEAIDTHAIDIVIVGPVTAAGMDEAGTLQETRAFAALLHDVRHRTGRHVTFVLIHHEGKSGKVSGAWEGTGDTLLHVTGLGHGRTRLHIQKARWAASLHATTLTLRWTDGAGFTIEDTPDLDDDDIAAEIRNVVSENPGTAWGPVERSIRGVGDHRIRTVRDRMLTDGQLVNISKVDGVEMALDHCPPRKAAQLHLADDPTVSHLRRESATVPPQLELEGAETDGQRQLRRAADPKGPHAVAPQPQPPDVQPPDTPGSAAESATDARHTSGGAA